MKVIEFDSVVAFLEKAVDSVPNVLVGLYPILFFTFRKVIIGTVRKVMTVICYGVLIYLGYMVCKWLGIL